MSFAPERSEVIATDRVRRPNKDLGRVLVCFYSYFHSEMKTLFAKSGILKLKMKLKVLGDDIAI